MLVAAQFLAKSLDFVRGIFHLSLIYNLNENQNEDTGEHTITYRKTVLIYNPRAGKFGRSGGRMVERIVETLAKNGHNVTAAPTSGPRTAGAIALEHIGRGADLVLAAGGDGTINEVAEGMVHSDVPLGVLPAGTANVLGTEMKLGSDPVRAAERLGECRPRRISVGHVTCDGGRVSRHFLLMAGIGLDAHVVRHVDASLKARTGKFAYWVAGWTLLGRRLAQVHVEIDGQKRECSFALLSKVRNYGGDFEIAKSVTLLDDQFEAVLFEGRTSLPYVKYFAAMALDRLKDLKGVAVLRTSRATLCCPEDRHVYVQIDGELAGHLPAEIEVVPDALTLLVPPGYHSPAAHRP
jgi:YegS/Rv2252/BmrU family lipid kinase